jgi:hypothetical protein
MTRTKPAACCVAALKLWLTEDGKYSMPWLIIFTIRVIDAQSELWRGVASLQSHYSNQIPSIVHHNLLGILCYCVNRSPEILDSARIVVSPRFCRFFTLFAAMCVYLFINASRQKETILFAQFVRFAVSNDLLLMSSIFRR